MCMLTLQKVTMNQLVTITSVPNDMRKKHCLIHNIVFEKQH